MAANIIPYITIALQAEPELLALIQSIRSLVKKYPTLTPEQITALVQQAVNPADQEFDVVLAKIHADQAGTSGSGASGSWPMPAPPSPGNR